MLSGRRMCAHVGGGFGTARGPESSDSCMCVWCGKGGWLRGWNMLATCKFPPSSRSGRCAANHKIEFSSENGNEGRKGKFHRRRFSRCDSEKFYFHVFLGHKSFHFGPIAKWINGSKKKKQKSFPCLTSSTLARHPLSVARVVELWSPRFLFILSIISPACLRRIAREKRCKCSSTEPAKLNWANLNTFRPNCHPDASHLHGHYFITLSSTASAKNFTMTNNNKEQGELERRPCGRRSDNFHFFNYFLCRKMLVGDQESVCKNLIKALQRKERIFFFNFSFPIVHDRPAEKAR